MWRLESGSDSLGQSLGGTPMPLFAVIDVETTGLYPYRHDRIVEVAAVMMGPDGIVLREFTSLVNPERDIGPTSIHGLVASDVAAAPRFGDIAGRLLETVDGCVALAGHNIRFDRSFLAVEFSRMGHAFPDGPLLCTLELAGGGSLSSCCGDYGIPCSGGVHTALHDARVTAQLLAAILEDAPHKAREISQMLPIAWPCVAKSSVPPLTRDAALLRKSEPPTYLQRLLARTRNAFLPDTDESDEIAYIALIDRALEDRRVDESEGEALYEMAVRWGIDGTRAREIHRRYLDHLVATALADGIITSAERRDLSLVASLLGVEQRHLDQMLEGASQKLSDLAFPPQPSGLEADRGRLTDKRVCFTGESQCCHQGMAITREMAAELATRYGLTVVDSVTKKLDLLIVSDPNTQAGKAKKARQYGIRIMHERVFWKELGIEVA
jgi:DNA polymerase-3 subunit epsilon